MIVARHALLALLAVLAAGCSQEARTPHSGSGGGGSAELGEALVRDYACGVCHTIPGVHGARGTVGPSLDGFAERDFIAGRVPNGTDELVVWLQAPPVLAPGTAMPDMGVTAEEAAHMAAYLQTLDGDRTAWDEGSELWRMWRRAP